MLSNSNLDKDVQLIASFSPFHRRAWTALAWYNDGGATSNVARCRLLHCLRDVAFMPLSGCVKLETRLWSFVRKKVAILLLQEQRTKPLIPCSAV